VLKGRSKLMETNFEVATREILWMIPSYFSYLMYFLFLAALAYLIIQLRKKIRLALATPEGVAINFGQLVPTKLNWGAFFETIFAQGKVNRKTVVAFFHGFIFFSFLVLIFATILVGIHADTPWKIFQGTLYKLVSFWADWAAIFIVAGVIMAFCRRYISRPDYLQATNPKREIFMYFMLLNLAVIGLLLEAIRINQTGMMWGDSIWSPVGYFIAALIGPLDGKENIVITIYRVLWMEHMLSTMLFLAFLPCTKFFHTLLAPFNALITPSRQGAILLPMNFENENAETFGLGKVSELTVKNRIDTISCVECGRCTMACPANRAGKNLNPKTIITKLRDFSERSHAEKLTGELWGESPLYAFSELDACTTCGACMEGCPMSIEHVKIIMESRRYKTLTLAEIPPSAGDATNKIKNNSNPWGIAQHDRFNWAAGLNLPIINEGQKVDYLYFIGCAGSYDAANQKVVKDTIKLFQEAKVSFALLGGAEKCCGDPIRRFGDEYSFLEIAQENIATFSRYKFDAIVMHCPHCMHTIGKEYAKFEGGIFKTIHHSELLEMLLAQGKLSPKNAIAEKVTFHDPCYIGRHDGNYHSVRNILKKIKGVKLTEMKAVKEEAFCCGMGGGNMWYELPEGEHLVNGRLREVGETKCNKLITACSYCLINFNSSKNHVSETGNIEIEDIASLLAKSVF